MIDVFYYSRSSLASTQDSLDLQEVADLIPPAPPISLNILESIPMSVYESRTSQILNAKGTLKKKQKSSIISNDFQFFLHENEEIISDFDSVSLVSEEDFAGVKKHIKDGHMTIRSHRGNNFLVQGVSVSRSKLKRVVAQLLRRLTKFS